MKIQFTPRWPGPIQGRAVNLSRQFYPSLAAYYEVDDLLQEAYIVFMRCKGHFQVGGGPALFMAFFSKSFHNKLCSMVKCNPRYILADDMDQFEEPASADDLGYLLCTLKEFPKELLDLLGTFTGNLPEAVEKQIHKRLRGMQRKGVLRNWRNRSAVPFTASMQEGF